MQALRGCCWPGGLNAQPPEKKTNNRKAREPLEMAKAKLGDRQSRSAAFRIEGS
jgi:hypothetical protein